MLSPLLDILRASAPADALQWLEVRLAEQGESFDRRPFYYAFSGVSRRFPKRTPLVIPDKAASQVAGAGLSLEGWDCFRLARVILLLSLARQERETFLGTLSALLNTADYREQTAIYSAFPLLPRAEDLVEFAVDGLRSNIVDVFDSIALGNPFPAAHFSEAAWNQMVLKAVFLNRPLYRIEGLDQRRNAALASSLRDLAHERWAAGRRLPPEAWRNFIGFVDQALVADLRHLLEAGEEEDRAAVALLISSDEHPWLSDLRPPLERPLQAIAAGELTWDRLGAQLAQPSGLNGAPTAS